MPRLPRTNLYRTLILANHSPEVLKEYGLLQTPTGFCTIEGVNVAFQRLEFVSFSAKDQDEIEPKILHPYEIMWFPELDSDKNRAAFLEDLKILNRLSKDNIVVEGYGFGKINPLFGDAIQYEKIRVDEAIKLSEEQNK